MNIDQEMIEKWTEEGTITSGQAQKMLQDLNSTKKEKKSTNLVLVLSTIGAILFGIGAILLIASNWQELSDLTKTLLIVLITFAVTFAGHYLAYQKKTYPLVGQTLLFLGALLFGATIILITQIYNINANSHMVVLIWLIGILPLLYILRSHAIAFLVASLFYLWVALFFTQSRGWWFFETLGRTTIPLFIMISVVLFTIGGVHYFWKEYAKIARTFRLISLKVFLFCLFLLTFPDVVKISTYRLDRYHEVLAQVGGPFLALAVMALASFIINWIFNKSKSISKWETPVGAGIVLVVTFFVFNPTSTYAYAYIFNIIYAFLVGLIIYLGIEREDTKLLDIGFGAMGIYILAKYFDWFWSLLDRSFFFLAGGVILIGGGIFLEKKRKELRKSIKK